MPSTDTTKGCILRRRGPCYNLPMSITEIKTIISQLPPPELAGLTEWFEELQADAWDRQIERDALAGRFEAVFQRVDGQTESGRRRGSELHSLNGILRM